MDKIMVCPHCQGRKEMPILNAEKFDKEGIVQWKEELCRFCKGKGFIIVDTNTLEKI